MDIDSDGIIYYNFFDFYTIRKIYENLICVNRPKITR